MPCFLVVVILLFPRVALALIPLLAWTWFRPEGAGGRRPEKLSEYVLLILPGLFSPVTVIITWLTCCSPLAFVPVTRTT